VCFIISGRKNAIGLNILGVIFWLVPHESIFADPTNPRNLSMREISFPQPPLAPPKQNVRDEVGYMALYFEK